MSVEQNLELKPVEWSDVKACSKWSLIAGVIAYAVMLISVGKEISADIMIMCGAIIGVGGFCFAADYYSPRRSGGLAFLLCFLAWFMMFVPFGVIRFCRILLYVCHQLPNSETLVPNGFNLPWQIVLPLAFLVWVGNFFYRPLKHDFSHPYSNMASIAIIMSLIGVLLMMEILVKVNGKFDTSAVMMTIGLIFVLLTILNRFPCVWNRECGVIIGAAIGLGVPVMAAMFYLF